MIETNNSLILFFILYTLRNLGSTAAEYLAVHQSNYYDKSLKSACYGHSKIVIMTQGNRYRSNQSARIGKTASQTSDRLFIWTHYCDRDVIYNNTKAISQNLDYRDRFTITMSLDYKGFNCVLYRQEYKASLDNPGFCGGSNSFSYWMRREILYRA